MTNAKKAVYCDILETNLKEIKETNAKLQEENNHFVYLERLNIEYKTYEPRLRELAAKEELVKKVMQENDLYKDQSKINKS